MNILFKTFLVATVLLSGQTALATPKTDAAYIAQRGHPALEEYAQRSLKTAFVTVYFKSLSGLGIEIANMDRFMDLIPDEDIAPFVERLMSRTIEHYLKIFKPDQLSMIATILRADEDATIADNLTKKYEQDLEIGQASGIVIGHLFTLMAYGDEIRQLERKPDHPVTIAALKADGILDFSNRVQRQTLLRRLEKRNETSGIQFAKPPAKSAETD